MTYEFCTQCISGRMAAYYVYADSLKSQVNVPKPHKRPSIICLTSVSTEICLRSPRKGNSRWCTVGACNTLSSKVTVFLHLAQPNNSESTMFIIIDKRFDIERRGFIYKYNKKSKVMSAEGVIAIRQDRRVCNLKIEPKNQPHHQQPLIYHSRRSMKGSISLSMCPQRHAIDVYLISGYREYSQSCIPASQTLIASNGLPILNTTKPDKGRHVQYHKHYSHPDCRSTKREVVSGFRHSHPHLDKVPRHLPTS